MQMLASAFPAIARMIELKLVLARGETSMTRLLIVVMLASTVSACEGGSSPSAPSRDHSDAPAAGSFAAAIQGSAGAAHGVDLARCLQGELETACFSGRAVQPQSTSAAVTGAPQNLSATAVGSSVTLTWVAPIAGDSVKTYVIEAGSTPGAANLANFATGNSATTFSATGVGAGTYFVRVRAVDAAGQISAPSNEAVLVVGGSGPCVPPGPPSALAVASLTGGTVVLTWNPATGSPTSYVVEAGSSPGLSNLANSDVGLTTSMTATGVGAGTYYVRMRAKNSCGASGPSNEVILVVGGGPAPGPSSSFGPGQYLVGRDIAPGRYYSTPSAGCYWERQSGLGGGLVDILANEFIGFNAAQWVVDILASDLAFETGRSCGTWFNTRRAGVQSAIQPGVWVVGTQITPGTYRAAAAYGCYWARLRDFTAHSNIIANDFVSSAGQQLVAIAPTDVGFETNLQCGAWTRVSGLSVDTLTISSGTIEANVSMKRSTSNR
jgi:hypothetical protein